MLSTGRFGDPALEQVYRQHQLGQHLSTLVYVLCVFTAALILLALNHLSRPDLVLLLATVAAALALALNIMVNVRRRTQHGGLFVAAGLWLCGTVLCMLVAGGQSGLLPAVVACFTLYTLFPFDLFWTVLASLFMAVAQTAVFVLNPMLSFTLDQLLATIVVHAWTNFIGIYLFAMKSRLSRAVFLNSRNVLMSQVEALKQQGLLESLLSAVCPRPLLQKGLNYLCENPDNHNKVNVDCFRQASVLYAKFSGLEDLLSLISLQDSGRLLNEFEQRVNLLAQRYELIRVASSDIVLVGLDVENEAKPEMRVSQAAMDLSAMVRGFCDATNAELQVKVGLASGPLCTAFLGASKWHYDVTGPALDQARRLAELAGAGAVLVQQGMRAQLQDAFQLEQLELQQRVHWRLVSAKSGHGVPAAGLLFPSQRRLSLTSLPQAVNRVLNACVPQSSASQSEAVLNLNGRRKRRMTDSLSEKLDVDESEFAKLLHAFSMEFRDADLERAFHFEVDRWFIPGLAITILFLVVYGLYQVLVMPRLIATLGLIVLSLVVIFALLLLLYISYFESFSHFVTQTRAGHTTTIFLILVLHFVCGIVNSFNCPTHATSRTCQVVYYPVLSLVLWMLTVPSFIRFGTKYLLGTLLMGIGVFGVHMFVTQAELYRAFGNYLGWKIEYDVMLVLATLTLLIFIQSRRNEKLIRMDFISHLKFLENMRRFDRVNELIRAQLSSQLPGHIAVNFFHRSDPYCHLCQAVGVVTVRFGGPEEWHGVMGLQRLQELTLEVDQLVASFTGLEKVNGVGGVFVVAVGVLPEVQSNVHDVPFTIGDLLASLTNFTFALKEIAEDESLQLGVGVDCGAALSIVVGGQRPHYEVIGNPRRRSTKLMEAAAKQQNNILVSEDVYLALRPRNFKLNDRNPVQVAPGLIGFGFTDTGTSTAPRRPFQRIAARSQPSPHRDQGSSAESSDDDDDDDGQDRSRDRLIEEHTQSTTLPTMATQSVKDVSQYPLSFFAHHNNKDETMGSRQLNGLNSMNSSMSSELYSIDVSVETDSDMEWVTPEMMVYDKMKQSDLQNGHPPAGAPALYKGDCAKQYSDFSEVENFKMSSTNLKKRRKHRHRQRPLMSRNGPKLPSWLSSRSSFNSELSLPHADFPSALERLDSTSRRVDQMIQELAGLQPARRRASQHAFPLGVPAGVHASLRSMQSSRRATSSAAHTEYDNAESEAAFSDSEFVVNPLYEPDPARRSRSSRLSALARSLARRARRADLGADADLESNCSGSLHFDRLRWKSVHSIGYENEYEFASETELNASRQSGLSEAAAPRPPLLGAVGANIELKAVDADSDSDEDEQQQAPPDARLAAHARHEVQKLSEDIRRNFGDFKLATFSDLDG